MKAENIFAWIRDPRWDEASAPARGLAFGLVKLVDSATLTTHKSTRQIAQELGFTYESVRRWRRELKALGLITTCPGVGLVLSAGGVSTYEQGGSYMNTDQCSEGVIYDQGGGSNMTTPPAPPNKVSASFSASEKKEKKREEIRERGTTADTPEDPTPHAPPTPHAVPSPPPVLSKGRGQQEAQTEESVEALQIKREGALARMAPTHRVTLLEGRTDVLSASERMPRSQVLAIWEESTGVAWGRWSTAPIWRADALRWLAVVRVTLREDEWRRVCTLAGSKEAGDRVPLSWLTKAVNGVLGERRGRGAWRDHGSYTTTSTFSLVDERTEEQRARDMAAGRAILAEMEAMLSAPGPMLGAGREEVRV